MIVIVLPAARTATLAAGIQHLHFVGDDLGRIALNAILLPRASTQAAFDIDLRALLDILVDYLREAIEEHHAVPFRLFLRLTGSLVFPSLTSGQCDIAHGAAARKVARLGVCTTITYQNNLIYASARHIILQNSLLSRLVPRRASLSCLVYRKHSTN